MIKPLRLIKSIYPFNVPAGESLKVRPYVKNRAYLLIANPSTAAGAGNLWIGYGQPVTANAGFKVEPSNGVFEESLTLGGVSVQEVYLFNDGAFALTAIVIEGLEVVQ